MKHNRKIFILACVGAITLIASSCKKEYFTKVNVNPNSPSAVPPGVILSTVEGSLAYAQGGDMSRFSSMFTQQTFGLSRQSQAYYSYIFSAQDVDNLWGNLYTSVMENDLQLKMAADAKGYNVYSGISRVLMAYSLQITVDFWGSVPYSQALMGAVNLRPSFDADNVLYNTTILNLCDSAIYFLNQTNPGFIVPGADDAIYGGNAAAWIKFAHGIKARIYMHQSKGNVAMANNALSELALSFTSNSDNAVYNNFSTSSTGNNPWYQFNGQRLDISFDSSYLNKQLLAKSDPRFPALIDTTAANGGDYLGAYYGSAASPVEFITYEEQQFMSAEATLTAAGSLTAVQTFYQNGITASMNKLGVSSADLATYLSANGTLTAANALSMICYEEWVALYLNPEAWTMYRRTGYPALTPVSGTQIPRRLLYPQTELSYNKENLPTLSSTLFTPKIFWDK